MQIQRIQKNNLSFGVVEYDKAGLERLNKKLCSNANSFIESQKSNNTANILLFGDQVNISYKNQFYKIQNYCKMKFNELIFENDAHFVVRDGKSLFDIYPTDYPMYLQHLINKWVGVPFELNGKKGLFVTNTSIEHRINYGDKNIEYANAHAMASNIDLFEKTHKDVQERMLLEENSWSEAYKAYKKK